MRKLYLNFIIQQEAGVQVLILDGYLDITQTTALGEKLDLVCQSEKAHCVLDLTRLRSINSASLGVLINRIQDVRKRGGDLCIGGCSEIVEQVFKTFGFQNVFKFFPARREAIEYFSSKAGK
ncbi:STAS domain-containing protein [candidate division FCPU426 bacterium]|nr:STAS domain-containing protein [candidate division FCPU426 bacterium]